MQVKFLKEIVEDLIGKEAVPIIDLLVGKKDVNEFFIAKKLGLTINQTRNILYKMSDYGLVSFIRRKDKKKGWYIYFWTLNVYHSLNLFEQNLKKELQNLEEQLKSRQEKRYYSCKTCSIEVTEETALLNNFACPECEEVYTLSDNSIIAKELEKKINKIKKEIDLVGIERGKEGEKLEQKKTRKIKAEEKKRVKLRKINKAIRKNLVKKKTREKIHKNAKPKKMQKKNKGLPKKSKKKK